MGVFTEEMGVSAQGAGTTPAQPVPSPSPILQRPPDTLGSAAAVFSIVLAIAAAVLGYRIIRGGRGL